jgi:hypothetical protein
MLHQSGVGHAGCARQLQQTAATDGLEGGRGSTGAADSGAGAAINGADTADSGASAAISGAEAAENGASAADNGAGTATAAAEGTAGAARQATTQAVEVVGASTEINHFRPTAGGAALTNATAPATPAGSAAPAALRTTPATLVSPGNLGAGNFFGCVYQNCGVPQGRRRSLCSLLGAWIGLAA